MLAIDPDQDARKRIAGRVPGIHTCADFESVAQYETIILAVKPQHMLNASQTVATHLNGHKPLIISIAAGITLKALHTWLGKDTPIVRCMPNTPALLGSGTTALSCRQTCEQDMCKRAEKIMGAVGITVWCEESLMDAVTAVSGSGPAYFFLLTEVLVEAGCALGLPKDIAEQISTGTALGSARMMCESGVDVATLRSNVTSPGGTTERALEVLAEGGVRKLWIDAVRAAAERSAALCLESEPKKG
jgi:pyrroline-5-carboxylate reductase